MSPLIRLYKFLLRFGLLVCFLSWTNAGTYAQEPPESNVFSDYKGVTVHLLVQPSWQNKSRFDAQLQDLGYPSMGPFGIHFGLGASYVFRTGTSVGLEFAYLSSSRELNNNFTRVQPHLYALNVKQYFSDHTKARLFVGASLISIEQQYTVSQSGPPPTSVTQAITVRNTSRFQRHLGGLGASLGITFKGNDPTTRRFTDFVEIEGGYRFNIDQPYYTVQGSEVTGLMGDRFRQFYLSIRAGLFVRGKPKQRPN